MREFIQTHIKRNKLPALYTPQIIQEEREVSHQRVGREQLQNKITEHINAYNRRFL